MLNVYIYNQKRNWEKKIHTKIGQTTTSKTTLNPHTQKKKKKKKQSKKKKKKKKAQSNLNLKKKEEKKWHIPRLTTKLHKEYANT